MQQKTKCLVGGKFLKKPLNGKLMVVISNKLYL